MTNMPLAFQASTAAMVFALLLTPVPCRAHEGPHVGEDSATVAAGPVPDAIAFRPTAIPDRILLTWTGDPAHSQSATWRTDESVTTAQGQISKADHGPNFTASARTVSALTTPLETDLGKAHYHCVQFEGLEPATKYAYRVGNGEDYSEWFHFQTASEQPEPFTFLYFGDAQNDIKSLWSRIIRGAYGDAPKARFLLHAGDLVNKGSSDANWGEWHAAGGWVNGMIPSLPVPGNHEYDRVVGLSRQITNHWRTQFTLPENGPDSLQETAYFLDFQGVRMVVLNSNEHIEDQARWLEGVLGENPNRWTIASFHHPVQSAARGRDNKAIREAWQPLLDRYRVDLVLQGHDHTYARSGATLSNVPTGTNLQRPGSGTVYVVSVSGPKMYNLERQPWMKRAAEDTQLYQIITIAGDTLRFEARTALGTLYDAFELRKKGEQPNELLELPVELPERLRTPAPAATKAASL